MTYFVFSNYDPLWSSITNIIILNVHVCRCGVALDPNLIPVHDEVYENGIDQPLMTINSEIGYQWKDNVDNIKRLLKNTTEGSYTVTIMKLFCWYVYTTLIHKRSILILIGKDSQTPVVTLRYELVNYYVLSKL